MPIRGVTSPEHENCIRFIAKKFNLKIVEIKGITKGKYFPDAKNRDTDYEIEVVPRTNYISLRALMELSLKIPFFCPSLNPALSIPSSIALISS